MNNKGQGVIQDGQVVHHSIEGLSCSPWCEKSVGNLIPVGNVVSNLINII
jgi:hypothetical protein